MSNAIKVVVVGATGKTGQSIVDGLLTSETNFDITAVGRASSITGAAYDALKQRGVRVEAADLTGPEDDLVKLLTGVDVVISTIVFTRLYDQIHLAKAAKRAGVKRFVPSDFGTPTARGVMRLHNHKDDVLAAIQRLHLPYTIIAVGWWAEHSVPAVPSGRTDSAVSPYFNIVPGDGTTPNAYTHISDIGRYVAKIIADPRTLNKKVFAYTDVYTANQIAGLMEELSGEKAVQRHVTAEEISKVLDSARAKFEANPEDIAARIDVTVNEYIQSWGFRGDNTPELAEYFGYLDFKKLYPGVGGKTLRTFYQEVLEGGRKDAA